MVESSDSRKRNDFRSGRWSRRDLPLVGRVFVEAQVTTVLVVVAEIQAHEPHEMVLAEDDNVFENLTPTISDPAFCRSVLLYRRLHLIRALHQNVFESPIRSTRM